MRTPRALTHATPRDARPSGPAGRPSDAGFTLIELLVVVSVVALLIGIILPSLQFARARAQDVTCQANLHNLTKAWHTYISERGKFPHTVEEPTPIDRPPYAGNWGGATTRVLDHFGRTVSVKARILNEYVGLDSATRSRMDFFRCPRDTGTLSARSKTSLRDANGNQAVYADEGSEAHDSMFFIDGNSYYVNDWIWAPVGAIDGAGPQLKRWHNRNRPDQVLAYPAMTMALADGGCAIPLSLTQQQRETFDVGVGWWHGPEQSNMAMWDGSVKLVASHVGGAGPEFFRWLIPERHPPEGTPLASMPALRNPHLAEQR
jgi:prepilin-type N-terminal cleavage/methylation domain-containing protein/prepilin-type processing-associated H-X9-DG protein